MPYSAYDRKFMRLALRLGAKGKGSTFPNPPVGAVIVKEGRVIGRGWHRYRGEPHAEVRAIEDAREKGEDIRGATMYVTLEPCCHHGLTPPCTDAIVAGRIGRVVISCRDDFDDRVRGRAAGILMQAGIPVEVGLLGEEGAELIEQYRVQRTESRAFLSVKWAQSLSGRIATKTGGSRWITGESARRIAHRLRSQHGAVAVGARTAVTDDPRLTVRMVRSHNTPARIVLAGRSKLPSRLKLFSGGPRTIVVHDGTGPVSGDTGENIEFLRVPRGPDFWKTLLAELPGLGIGSMLLEGGSDILTSAFREGVVDRVYCFIAPTVIGEGIPAIGNLEITRLENAIKLEKTRTIRLGEDILITGEVARP